MEFKICNTKIKPCFSFFALILLLLIKGNNRLLIVALVVSLVHELIHLIFLLILKCRIDTIKLSVLGGNIIRDRGCATSHLGEALINFSAPLFNILTGIIILIFSNGSPWAYVNILIGVFNILPFYNSDGGNGLYHLLTVKFTEKASETAIIVLSCFIVAAFVVINLYFIFAKVCNPTLIVINIYFIAVLAGKFISKSGLNA